MNIHEYQGKQLLSKYGVAVPKGHVAYTVDEAVKAAEELGGGMNVLRRELGDVESLGFSGTQLRDVETLGFAGSCLGNRRRGGLSPLDPPCPEIVAPVASSSGRHICGCDHLSAQSPLLGMGPGLQGLKQQAFILFVRQRLNARCGRDVGW